MFPMCARYAFAFGGRYEFFSPSNLISVLYFCLLMFLTSYLAKPITPLVYLRRSTVIGPMKYGKSA